MKIFSVLAAISLIVLCAGATAFSADITSAATGSWSATGTWVGGVVPTAADNVAIASGHTVTIDVNNAECNDLTASGYLYFNYLTSGNSLTVYGNTTVNGTGRLRAGGTTPSGIMYQYLTLYKNLTVISGGSFDMRTGTGTTVCAGRVLFVGTTNSTISLALTTYGSSTEEFNSVVINKSGGAKVILNSGNLFQNNNSTNAPDTLVFVSGIIETVGSTRWVHLATSSNAVTGASANSYINGTFGRGLSNGTTSYTAASRQYEVGDATGYRPITLESLAGTPQNATGHYVWAKLVGGDANTVSGTYSGGINKTSLNRYYLAGYFSGGSGVTAITYWRLSPTYQTDDGVSTGNTDLRVAYKTSTGSDWIGIGPSAHTTAPSSTPTKIDSDSLQTGSTFSINTGDSVYISLANATSGVNELPVELVSFSAEVERSSAVLRWSTATEANNYGFEIERRSETATSWEKAGFVIGAGTSTSAKSYKFHDRNLNSGTYTYRLKQIDKNGSFKYIGTETSIRIGTTPKVLSLDQNYPNPFNPSTSVEFTVPEKGRATLKIFNLLGQLVATLFNGDVEAGKIYRAEFNAAALSSGIYIYQLNTGTRQIARRMTLMK